MEAVVLYRWFWICFHTLDSPRLRAADGSAAIFPFIPQRSLCGSAPGMGVYDQAGQRDGPCSGCWEAWIHFPSRERPAPFQNA